MDSQNGLSVVILAREFCSAHYVHYYLSPFWLYPSIWLSLCRLTMSVDGGTEVLSTMLFPVMYYMMRRSGDLSLDYGAGAAMTEENGGDAAMGEDAGAFMTEHNGGEAAMGDGAVAAMTEENGGAAAMDDGAVAGS